MVWGNVTWLRWRGAVGAASTDMFRACNGAGDCVRPPALRVGGSVAGRNLVPCPVYPPFRRQLFRPAAGDVVIGLDQISHAMGEGGVAAVTIRNDLAEGEALVR